MSDAALACRDWLRSEGFSVATGGPQRSDDVQLVVTKVGGSTTELVEQALIQIDVWGTDSYAECAATTQQVKAALLSLNHESLNPSTFGFGSSGIVDRFLPDPEAERPRFAITTTLTVQHRGG
jgi:hypothetical protein